MEKIKKEAKIDRYDRLRNVIEQLKEREFQYEIEVLSKFDTLDMYGIEKLAQERQQKKQYREQLEKFLKKYEQKNGEL